MMLAALAGMVFALRSDPLLDDVQKRAVQFFWNESDARTGFTKDRALNTEGKTDNYTIASCAATGYAFIAYAIGVEHKWLDRKQALQRTRATLKHLNNDWEQSHGWLYHFVDWKSGERVWKCEASSVDTSLCLAGILFAEKYWNDPEVSAEAQAFENRIDWKWMLTDGGKRPDETHYSMGWHPNPGLSVIVGPSTTRQSSFTSKPMG